MRPGAEPKLSTVCCGATRVARGAVGGAMRCGHQSWLRCGVGARGLGARGEEVSRASQPVVDRSVPLIDLFALISDRLRVDSR